jgi:hypothetical protein
MIQCPKCKSTSQIQVISGDNLNYIWVGSMNYVQQILSCKCGCEFVRVFQYSDTIISSMK